MFEPELNDSLICGTLPSAVDCSVGLNCAATCDFTDGMAFDARGDTGESPAGCALKR